MESIREQFARAGLRCTRQRVELYRALASTKMHPTADELLQMVSATGEPISLATVYNTLDALCEAGLCRKLATTDGSVRYDADMSEHSHVRCRRTGRIVDIPNSLGARLVEGIPAKVLREIEREMGIHIDGVQIQLQSPSIQAESA